jgi:hypothetical protein
MKKIVRLTESKLVELIRGIVSEQQVNAISPEESKRLSDLNDYNSNLWDLKRKGKITPAQYMQKFNAANPKNKIKSPNEKTIPYVTTTKFLPPEIKHDEEVTKPEPAELEPLQESIQKILNRFKKSLNEGMGMIWLTKIKIDSPKQLTDEEKVAMTNKFQNSYNGRIAVEFGPNEWYDWNGRIEDIQKYEDHINNDVYGKYRKSPNAASFEKEVRQSRRDPNLEEPYDAKYASFDDYRDSERKKLNARLKDFELRRENGTLD